MYRKSLARDRSKSDSPGSQKRSWRFEKLGKDLPIPNRSPKRSSRSRHRYSRKDRTPDYRVSPPRDRFKRSPTPWNEFYGLGIPLPKYDNYRMPSPQNNLPIPEHKRSRSRHGHSRKDRTGFRDEKYPSTSTQRRHRTTSSRYRSPSSRRRRYRSPSKRRYHDTQLPQRMRFSPVAGPSGLSSAYHRRGSIHHYSRSPDNVQNYHRRGSIHHYSRSPDNVQNSRATSPSAVSVASSGGARMKNNVFTFECPICLDFRPPFAGVMLRNCGHELCIPCAVDTIKYSEYPEINCPYMNSRNRPCPGVFQDREIRALLTKPEYDKYLAFSLRFAAIHMSDAFCCKTPDCWGFCIRPIRHVPRTWFLCPICKTKNCLDCEAIHENMSCPAWHVIRQRNISQEIAKSEQQIKHLLATKVLRICPGCKALVEKIKGCNSVLCVYCHVEICWITGLKRRGPDGCRCGENGIPCHPKCKNCH